MGSVKRQCDDGCKALSIGEINLKCVYVVAIYAGGAKDLSDAYGKN